MLKRVQKPVSWPPVRNLLQLHVHLSLVDLLTDSLANLDGLLLSTQAHQNKDSRNCTVKAEAYRYQPSSREAGLTMSKATVQDGPPASCFGVYLRACGGFVSLAPPVQASTAC